MKLWHIFSLFILASGIVSCGKMATPEKKEQTLRFNLRKDPVSLDPRIGNDYVASQFHFLLFEGLLRLNPDLSLSPAQAKSYEISPDGKTYTFHLAGTQWSDGSLVTASDFEKSWKSLLDPQFPCNDAYLLFSIKNAKAVKKGELPVSQAGIRALDEKTLQVELEQPTPYFLQIVASSVFLPVKMSISDPNWATSPKHFICNGPFLLKRWQFNQELQFEKNPKYRISQEVKLDRISVEIIDREMASLHMYASGHFDLVGTPLSFFPAILHEDLERKKLLAYYPVAMTKFVAFNTSKFPFQNANIRRAFSYAIDRKSIIENITQLQETEALNIIPPTLLGGQTPPTLPENHEELARECFEKGLKELGVKELGPISFMYVSSELNHLMSQQIQERWKKLFGVKVDLDPVEFKVIHEKSKKGDFSIGLYLWVADYADPMNILERFADKSTHRNYGKWDNKEFAELLEKALLATSQEDYKKLLSEAEALMLQESPIACLFHDHFAFLAHPHVRGLDISPLGHIYFDKISIDPSKKPDL